MYRKNVVRRNCVKLLLLGVISLMFYGNLHAATETLDPNAVGSEENLTSIPAGDNYLTVNDADDATFVHTASAFVRDLYNLSTYAGSGTISQIEVFARATNINGWSPPPSDNLKICIQPGGGANPVYESSTFTTGISYTYTEHSNIWTQNPNGPVDWVWADILNLQAGVSLKGAFMNNTRCAKVWVVITYTSDPPIAPSECLATNNHCADIVIEWTDNSSDETAFYIYRDGSKVGEVGADVTTHTDYPDPGTYNYYVKAYNTGGGTSGASDTDGGERLTTPDIPANCQATDNDYDKIVITWNNVTGETGFKIYRDAGYLDGVLADILTYTDNTAASGTYYSYQVSAYTTHTVPDPDVTCESALSTADNGVRPLKYYVREPEHGGSDANNGTTSATAWATIQHAADNMTIPGDIVYVGAGIYAEEVSPGYPGNATDLISYIADPTGIYMNDDPGDSVLVAPTGLGEDGFLFSGPNAADYVKIDGFEINANNGDGINVQNRTGIVISNNTIHGNDGGNGIRAGGSTYMTISGNAIYSNILSGIYQTGSNATISNNTIYDNASGIHSAGSSSKIDSNSIYSNGGSGIEWPGVSSTISNNAIYSNGECGIYANNANDLTIKNNLIYFHEGGVGGIDCPGNGSIISNNTIYHNKLVGSSADHDGIHVLHSADITVTITNNIITSNTRGIVRGTGTNYTLNISHNLLYDNTIANYVNCSAGTGDIVGTEPRFVNVDTASKAPLDLHIQSDGDSYHGGVWGANAGGGSWIADDSCSPCVDMGKTTGDDSDYSNEPANNGGRINMGAFGNTAQASKKCGVSAVELVSFDAQSEKGCILLNWRTECEIDNDKWLIKRCRGEPSSPTEDWEQITELHAQGVPNNYIYIDSLITPGRAYWYKLGDVDKCGKITWHGPVLAKAGRKIKFSFFLKEPAANPSTGKVRLEYSVSGYQGDKQRPVTLKIYNISGQVVKTLIDERQKPGHYTIWWDGKNDRDNKVASGTYFCHFRANGESVRKLIRIK